MEWWFIWSLVAAVFAGLHAFMQKIGATRGYNSGLLNSYSTGLSATLGFVVAGFIEGFSALSFTMVGVAFLSGVTYIVSTNFRGDALKYIDTTILFPLHKFISPLGALVIGVLYFSEQLTSREIFGLTLGITVPLLLISRVEHRRQKQLNRGLGLVVVSAILAALSAAVNKEGAVIFSSVLLFAAVAQSLSAGVGLLLYRFRRRSSAVEQKEHHHFDRELVVLAIITAGIQFCSFISFMLAFSTGGPLAMVYTIHSLYIVIPIMLAIIFYREHWNWRKILAIVLSISALWFMR